MGTFMAKHLVAKHLKMTTIVFTQFHIAPLGLNLPQFHLNLPQFHSTIDGFRDISNRSFGRVIIGDFDEHLKMAKTAFE